MDCSFCAGEGVSDITSAGDCFVCRRSACTHPSGRLDQRFHGYVCACTCGVFVCRPHFASHSRTHAGGAPSICFPTPTLLSAGAALAVIERQLGPTFDIALPMAETEPVGDFVAHFAMTSESARAAIAASQGIAPQDVPENELPTRMVQRLQGRSRVVLVAPLAFNALHIAWNRAEALNELPAQFQGLRSSYSVMERAMSRGGAMRDPLAPAAIDAYAAFSPRIAAALHLLVANIKPKRFRRFQSPLDTAPLFGESVPDVLDDESDALTRIAYLPAQLAPFMPQSLMLAR